MNNIQQFSLMKLSTSIEDADDMAFGLDTYNSGRLFFEFVLYETITQYFYLPKDVTVASVIVDGCNVSYIQIGKKVVISFTPLTIGCKRIVINDSIYSNIFNVVSVSSDYSSLITYWNDESHYSLDYEGVSDSFGRLVAQQIRLPIWYSTGKVNSKAKEIKFDRTKPTTKIIYEPDIEFTNLYKCAFNNWVASRFSVIAASDYIYINNQRVGAVEFNPEDFKNGADFAIHEWEVQHIYIDNEFVDLVYPNNVGLQGVHYDSLHYDSNHYSTIQQ